MHLPLNRRDISSRVAGKVFFLVEYTFSEGGVIVMGFFGGKKQDTDSGIDMLIITIETIDKPFEALGLVTATILKAHDPNPEIIAKELAKKAKNMGADAILGFRYDVRTNALNWTDQVGYGTAIKFK